MEKILERKLEEAEDREKELNRKLEEAELREIDLNRKIERLEHGMNTYKDMLKNAYEFQSQLMDTLRVIEGTASTPICVKEGLSKYWKMLGSWYNDLFIKHTS